jgi:hypothetical protein
MANLPFHVLEWLGGDRWGDNQPSRFVVTGFGRNPHGKTCSVSFAHMPSFLVRSDQRSLDGVLSAVTDILGDAVQPSSGLVSGKPFTKWQDSEEPFLRLVFDSKKNAKSAAELFRNPELSGRGTWNCPAWFLKGRLQFETYEADADPMLEALVLRGIPTTGWVRASAPPVHNPAKSKSQCQLHYECVPVPLSDDDVPERSAPHVVATFDIECFASESTEFDQLFPDPAVDGDVVTQIVTFFNRFGEKAHDALALVLLGPGGVAPDVKTAQSDTLTVRVEYFHREAELLRAWVREYARQKVSVWQHFNGLVRSDIISTAEEPGA